MEENIMSLLTLFEQLYNGADTSVRMNAESQLYEYARNSEFIYTLLDLLKLYTSKAEVKMSIVLYLKNMLRVDSFNIGLLDSEKINREIFDLIANNETKVL